MSMLAGIIHRKTRGCLKAALYMLLLLPILAACSGGDAAPPPAATTGTTGGTTTTPTDNITMSAMTFGVNPLSAYGTTSVSVNVLNNGVLYTTPVTVNFSSPCATAGKADLTASTSTVNGVASVSYVDNACAGSDVVTAAITGGPSASNTLTVNAPDSGSLLFVSASPLTINLRGTGGTETAKVIFKVLDISGNAIGGKTVNFSLNTTVGGITLSSASSISDANGEVSVDVHAGTVGTPVRVTATTLTNAGLTLSTQSSQLIISTGYPDQDSFSLSNQTYNIEGWNWDGTTTTLTIRLADHFNNPVPDGTAVSFVTEGGVIDPSCTTTNGSCTVTLTTQDPRPADALVTVLAYAIGEESFNDLDGDGLADLSPNETVGDMPEAWVDLNYDGVRDAGEPIIDFNANATYDPADGMFNTGLCNETPDTLNPSRVSSAGSCSPNTSIHVRDSVEIVFSSSYIGALSPASVTLSACTETEQEILVVLDENGNPMPAGTTITLTYTGPVGAGGTSSFTVGNGATGGLGRTDFPFLYKAGATCASGTSGSLAIKVTTPKSVSTIVEIPTNVL